MTRKIYISFIGLLKKLCVTFFFLFLIFFNISINFGESNILGFNINISTQDVLAQQIIHCTTSFQTGVGSDWNYHCYGTVTCDDPHYNKTYDLGAGPCY